MTTETLNEHQRLSAIFMPYATAKHKKLRAENGRFVHYTSAQNAINIIKKQELWMRNARCMNDYTEISHGYEQLEKFFQKDNADNKAFKQAVEKVSSDLFSKTLERFNSWWDKIALNTFIVSISEHEKTEADLGRLSMWRAYSDVTAKAAIVLNIPETDINNPLSNLILSPVGYLDYTQTKAQLLEITKNIESNYNFIKSIQEEDIIHYIFSFLLMACVSIKHKGFEEEKEWRIVYLPEFSATEVIKKDVETINGTPQVIYKIPLKEDAQKNVRGNSIDALIERIIIGPSDYPLAIIDAFIEALKNVGVANPENRVTFSNIPLRR